MTNLIQLIRGKKTYIIGAAVALLVYLKVMNVIDQDMFETLTALFGAGGLVTMRSAIQKAEDAAVSSNV